MKSYPSIAGSSRAPRKPCIAFNKYDGSNLRAEWSRKTGWTKFGTRKRLFDESDPDFGSAIPLFHETMADGLIDIFKKKYRDDQQITVFMEFFGPNSFAGKHEPADPKELILIDVSLYKKGLIAPREFVKNFDSVPSAEVIYEGNLNEVFIEAVRNGEYPVVEGVVCKGGSGHDLWMCKIKTNEYLKKLKEVFNSNWKDYWE